MNRIYGLALLLVLLTHAVAGAAGLPVARKTVTVKNKDVDISIEYPRTGNRAIDATLLAYAKDAVAQFEGDAVDKPQTENAYTLETTYAVERNDGKMFAVVFNEYTFTGGAHPNDNTVTFNFLLPDGARVFLPEIVDGARGIATVSQLATAQLTRVLGNPPDPSGAGPLADNFKAFVWLPTKLHIYFPPYQVAAYAAGPQEAIIPLAQLQNVIRADWRAPAPSFDCSKAARHIETAICADAALARLDRQTAEAYQTKLNFAYAPADKDRLRQSQRDWIATRNARCHSAALGACLTKMYRDRLAVLMRPPA